MDKPPSTIKDCVFELVSVIEQCKDFPQDEKAFFMDAIRNELVAYLKLKEWISDQYVL